MRFERSLLANVASFDTDAMLAVSNTTGGGWPQSLLRVSVEAAPSRSFGPVALLLSANRHPRGHLGSVLGLCREWHISLSLQDFACPLSVQDEPLDPRAKLVLYNAASSCGGQCGRKVSKLPNCLCRFAPPAEKSFRDKGLWCAGALSQASSEPRTAAQPSTCSGVAIASSSSPERALRHPIPSLGPFHSRPHLLSNGTLILLFLATTAAAPASPQGQEARRDRGLRSGPE